MMASESNSEHTETFVIRRAVSLDDIQWVVKMAVEEGFTAREKEAECYFLAGLTPNFYIGEVKGERIGCTSLVRHGDSVAVGGHYILAKPYRGSGFGKKMYEMCLTAGDQCNIQTLSLMDLKDFHEERGFQPGWTVRVYEFTASQAVEGLASSQLPPLVDQILPASQVDFEKLFSYSADMLGTSQTCKLLLAAWLSYLQKSSWVAIDNKGEVIGYLIMSETTHFPEEGYYIAPFYADSVPIARSLLKVAVEFASANNPRHNIGIDLPADFNPEGVSIMEKEIGAKCTYNLIFMANKEIPNLRLSKVFSIASCQVL